MYFFQEIVKLIKKPSTFGFQKTLNKMMENRIKYLFFYIFVSSDGESIFFITKATIWHLQLLFLSSLSICSSIGSLSRVRTLLWPQGALPLWFPLPAPLRQQDLHILLPSQQHGIQILLQRDRVPDGHAVEPNGHVGWIRTQVSYCTTVLPSGPQPGSHSSLPGQQGTLWEWQSAQLCLTKNKIR